MSNEKVNFENIVNHWISNSDKDFETMNHLFETKDFHWSLFIGHLVIEKLLKAKIVKETNEHAPFSHDLRRLAKLSGLSFNEEHLRWLDTITSFNLNARYDNYKQEFYLKCTPEFAAVWIKNHYYPTKVGITKFHYIKSPFNGHFSFFSKKTPCHISFN